MNTGVIYLLLYLILDSLTPIPAFSASSDQNESKIAHHGLSHQPSPSQQMASHRSMPTKKKIRVAVIDTGVDYKHPDIEAYLIKPPTPIDTDDRGIKVSTSAVHPTNAPSIFSDVQDDHGHGTHVTGLIIKNSNLSPEQLEILPLKYYSETATGPENLLRTLEALEFALSQNVDIINFSGGGPGASHRERRLLERAREQGIFVVCAAGNEGVSLDQRNFFPASYDLENILAVSALKGAEGPLLPSSNFGKTVHLAAPGHQLQSALPNDRRGPLTGTSQATAVVAGILAKILFEKPHQRGDFQRTKSLLINTSKFDETLLGKTQSAGGVDLKAALSEEGENVLFNQVSLHPQQMRELQSRLEEELNQEITKNKAPPRRLTSPQRQYSLTEAR